MGTDSISVQCQVAGAEEDGFLEAEREIPRAQPLQGYCVLGGYPAWNATVAACPAQQRQGGGRSLMSRVVPHLISVHGDEPCVCRTPSVKRQLPASRWLPFMANRQTSPHTTELIANQFHSFLDFNAGSSRRVRPLARSVAVRQATRMPWPSVLPRLGQPNVPCGLYHQQRHRRCQTSPVRSEHGAYRALPRRDQGHEVASPQVEAPTADHSWR